MNNNSKVRLNLMHVLTILTISTIFLIIGKTITVDADSRIIEQQRIEEQNRILEQEKIESQKTREDVESYIDNEGNNVLTLTLNTNKVVISKTDIPSFNVNDMTQVSNLSEESLTKILSGTNLQKYAKAYIEGEEKYKVNLLFVVAITALESSWGSSNIALNQNNFSGYAAYDGLGYGHHFESPEASIMETFRLLSEEYLNENGRYYNGKSPWNVNLNYCTSGDWADKVITIMNQLK